MSKRSKRESSKDSQKAKKAKLESETVLCDQCGKYFSKPSNLSAHVKKVHKGLRWICSICNQEQVSKHSHIRHYQTKHPDVEVPNTTENKRYVSFLIDMTDDAKSAQLKKLQDRLNAQEALMKMYRHMLLSSLKKNVILKASLGKNCEKEKERYNFILGMGNGESSEGTTDTSNDHGSFNDDDINEHSTSKLVEHEIGSDDSESDGDFRYPHEDSRTDDPLEHIEESDFGASSSKNNE